MANLTEEDKKTLESMANNMGVTVEQLLASTEDPNKLIESIKTGNYKILKEN